MKILMLITQLGYGGAEGAFLRLARELAKRHSVELVLFTPGYGGAYTEIAAETDLPMHLLDGGERAGRGARWFRRWRGLRRLKREFAADVTVSFLTGPNLLNVVARSRGRQVVSLRGSRRFDGHASALARLLYRWMVDPLTHALADVVIGVSEGVARESGGPRGVTSGKFVPISGYVDSDRLIEAAREPVEPEFEALRGTPLMVAAGRLSREKGFHHLLPLLVAVRNTVPGTRLMLIGDGPARRDLERAAERLGLTHASSPYLARDVIFAGHRPCPSRYFQLARLFVLPSASEGFPNILVEAMAAGVTVVAGDVPWGAREAMGVGADPGNRPYPRREALRTAYGYLLPRIDDAAFADQWISVLQASLTGPPPTRSELDARRRRVRELDCTLAAEKWESLLLRLIHGERPAECRAEMGS